MEDMEERSWLGGWRPEPAAGAPEALRLEGAFPSPGRWTPTSGSCSAGLMQQAGSISQAARLLGLSRQNLKYKLKI